MKAPSPGRRAARAMVVVTTLVALTACGGGSGGGSGPPQTVPASGTAGVTFSGTVSGLVGTGLTLELYTPGGGSDMHMIPGKTIARQVVNDNGIFGFAATAPAGAQIAVVQQPVSPAQQCVMTPSQQPATATSVHVSILCGEYLYLANNADNTVTAFSIDATSGALAQAGRAVGVGQSPHAIIGTVQKDHVFVTNGGSNDISVLDADPLSGALATNPGSPVATGASPASIAIFPDISAGNLLYVANAGASSVSAYQVDQVTGLPAALAPATYATPASPSVIAIDPNLGPLLVASAGGPSGIAAFDIGGISGLRPSTGSPLAAGSHVSSFVFAGRAYPIYAADASGASAAIYGYTYSADGSGVLVPLAGFPVALPSCNLIASDQTGTYLYATAGASLYGYLIHADTGALELLPGFPIALDAGAHSMSVEPTNQFLYIGTGDLGAGAITAFRLDVTTGALAPVPGSPFAIGKTPDAITTF